MDMFTGAYVYTSHFIVLLENIQQPPYFTKGDGRQMCCSVKAYVASYMGYLLETEIR